MLRPLTLSIALSIAPLGAATGAGTVEGRPLVCDIAIVGATLIDGNGGEPVRDAVVLVTGKRISAIGRRGSLSTDGCARTIDAAGKFMTPGFIDTNVHISMGYGTETFARYYDRAEEITLEGAQLHLKRGITTIRDSYGLMMPLLKVRDRINKGEAIGARVYVAGNIVGWGGNSSQTFSHADPKTLLEEQMNDAITQGAGEELIEMVPDSLHAAMNRYLNKGVDFVKFGGTSHSGYPTTLIFSERQVNVIVDETHRHGKPAETHSTSPEGLYIALTAGVDLVQHPEALDVPISDELVKMLVDKKVICSLHVNNWTGKSWQDYLAREPKRDSATKAPVRGTERKSWPARPKTQRELYQQNVSPFKTRVYYENSKKLIKAGCISSVATDNDEGYAPEFMRDPNEWRAREPGVGTLLSMEGLVELGMSPSDAIVAATKHGAMATRSLKDYGTIETGKLADLLLLNADPLQDIHNIHTLGMVMKEGTVIDTERLPTHPVLFRKPDVN